MQSIGSQKSELNPPQRSVDRPIIIEATAQMSGGRVYLDELLPRLMKELGGERFVVYGALLKKHLASSPSHLTA